MGNTIDDVCPKCGSWNWVPIHITVDECAECQECGAIWAISEPPTY